MVASENGFSRRRKLCNIYLTDLGSYVDRGAPPPTLLNYIFSSPFSSPIIFETCGQLGGNDTSYKLLILSFLMLLFFRYLSNYS